jgi:hypothetical protein
VKQSREGRQNNRLAWKCRETVDDPSGWVPTWTAQPPCRLPGTRPRGFISSRSELLHDVFMLSLVLARRLSPECGGVTMPGLVRSPPMGEANVNEITDSCNKHLHGYFFSISSDLQSFSHITVTLRCTIFPENTNADFSFAEACVSSRLETDTRLS